MPGFLLRLIVNFFYFTDLIEASLVGKHKKDCVTFRKWFKLDPAQNKIASKWATPRISRGFPAQ
jgi:hypothetical protein